MTTEITSDPNVVYQVKAARKGFDNEIDIAIMGILPDKVLACSSITMGAIEDGEEVKPILTIPFEEAVGLMTDLWNAGIRPEGVDLADSKTLLSVQSHLNDMRMFAVAFWNKMTGGQPTPTEIRPGGPGEPARVIQFPGERNPNGPDGEGQDKK